MKKLFCIFLFAIAGEASSAHQKISLPTAHDMQALANQRAVVERLLAPSDLRAKYKTAIGKLGTLRAVISSDVFSATQTYELQSMGVVLGDVFVLDMGFHWVVVEDAGGRDFAIQYKDTSVILFPLTILSKRIERGEQVDVFNLYNGLANQVEEILRNKPDKH